MNQVLQRITNLYQQSIGSVRRLLSFRRRAADQEGEAGNEAAPTPDTESPDSIPASEPAVAGLEPAASEQPTEEESEAVRTLGEPDLIESETVDDSDAVDLVTEPDHTEFQAGVDSEAAERALESENGDINRVEDSEAVDPAQAPETIEAGDVEESDIVDLAQEPEPVDLQASDDSDVVDLADEPEIVRPDEETTGDEESEVIRIDEEVGPEAAAVSETGGEALDAPPSETEQEPQEKKILGVLGRIKGLALFPLVKIKGIFKKDRQPAVDLGPGFALGTGQEKTRRSFSVPGPLVKAITITFIIVCLVAGGLVGLKISKVYSSRTAGQQGEPGPQTPSETTPQETPKTGHPAASSKPTGSQETVHPTVQPPDHPASKPPDHPTVQPPTPPAAQPPGQSTVPGMVDIPDKGKYDEPPYSKDVYQKGVR